MIAARQLIAAALLVFASAALPQAHHGSTLFFDHTKTITVEGTVQRVPGMAVAVRAFPQRWILALNDPLTVWPTKPGDPRHSPRIVEGGQVRLQDGELVRWGGGPKF